MIAFTMVVRNTFVHRPTQRAFAKIIFDSRSGRSRAGFADIGQPLSHFRAFVDGVLLAQNREQTVHVRQLLCVGRHVGVAAFNPELMHRRGPQDMPLRALASRISADSSIPISFVSESRTMPGERRTFSLPRAMASLICIARCNRDF